MSRLFVQAYRLLTQVESGEGIERSTRTVGSASNVLLVESGEGIERNVDELRRSDWCAERGIR